MSRPPKYSVQQKKGQDLWWINGRYLFKVWPPGNRVCLFLLKKTNSAPPQALLLLSGAFPIFLSFGSGRFLMIVAFVIDQNMLTFLIKSVSHSWFGFKFGRLSVPPKPKKTLTLSS